ncbi:MAG: YbaK/EbsC family protein [Candidatus Nanopelagicales bacterium]|nr:YbaK/EbsC family protein [Candidatus Nanopelagicales bacterium]MDZ4250792.1 YbaK/EbsC family protein [Candidatus Nanopelagicales bacterium]
MSDVEKRKTKAGKASATGGTKRAKVSAASKAAPDKAGSTTKASGSDTPATKVLGRAGIAYALHACPPEADADRVAAAEDYGIPARRLFETLVVKVEDENLIAVVPARSIMSLSAVAAAVGARSADYTDADEVERITGYAADSVSPLGSKTPLGLLLDTSAMEQPTILVPAGRQGLLLELIPDQLINLLRARTAPLCVS